MRDSQASPFDSPNGQSYDNSTGPSRANPELLGVFDSVSRPGLTDYEFITQLPFYRGQRASVSRWIAGTTLDVGSSFGRLSRLGTHVVSLDLDREALVRGVEIGYIRTAVQGSALALPFHDESFDTVLCIGIVEHIPPSAMPPFLDEVTRVAKQGGRLVIVATSPYAPFALLRLRLWGERLHPYSPFRLRALLRRRGWLPEGWVSTGLLGVTQILPRTVSGLVPWARTIGQVFSRPHPGGVRP